METNNLIKSSSIIEKYINIYKNYGELKKIEVILPLKIEQNINSKQDKYVYKLNIDNIRGDPIIFTIKYTQRYVRYYLSVKLLITKQQYKNLKKLNTYFKYFKTKKTLVLKLYFSATNKTRIQKVLELFYFQLSKLIFTYLI